MKRRNRANTRNKLVALSLALALLLCGAIGGTLAWLTDKTDNVVNTFTAGNIEIELSETFNTDTDEDDENDAWFGKMIPGWTIDKDPKVTVKANSEDCWLFVQVTESPNLGQYISYRVNCSQIAETTNGVTHGGWLRGNGTDIPANVYYRQVTSSANDQAYGVLGGGDDVLDNDHYIWGNDQVLVKPSVTKADMDALTDATLPTLTFKAYAVQYKNSNNSNFTVEQAWAKVPAPTT